MVCTGKFDFTMVITVTGTSVRANNTQGATVEELVAEMQKKFTYQAEKTRTLTMMMM